MKISLGLPADLSDGFWAEAANTATVLDNILLIPITGIAVHFNLF
jgi:hypothetical protein